MTTDTAGACPICGETARHSIVYRLAPFDVVRCDACGALQRDPLPTAEEMEGYYRDPGYIDGDYFAEVREGPEVAIFREALVWLGRRRAAMGVPEAGALLDVGAGSGGFLAQARRNGWNAVGIELSPELAARAAERSGAEVLAGEFERIDLSGRLFDAITMWDVLEHVADPGAVLDRACELLAPDGVLVVFTIDAASLFNVVADLAWRLTLGRLRAPLELLYDKRHNHYFTARTLRTLLARHGLRVDHTATHRAHLGRWLSEPASRLVLAGAEFVDVLSVPLRRPYRQLLYCVPGR